MPQAFGENLVQRGHAFPRVHHEQDDVAVLKRQFGLLAHARLQTVVRHVLVPGGVDQGQVHVADIAVCIATVTDHARAIVNEREALADKPVEQGRFAHVGAADDGDL